MAKEERIGGEDRRGVERIIVDEFILKVIISMSDLSHDVVVYYMTVWDNYRPL